MNRYRIVFRTKEGQTLIAVASFGDKKCAMRMIKKLYPDCTIITIVIIKKE